MKWTEGYMWMKPLPQDPNKNFLEVSQLWIQILHSNSGLQWASHVHFWMKRSSSVLRVLLLVQPVSSVKIIIVVLRGYHSSQNFATSENTTAKIRRKLCTQTCLQHVTVRKVWKKRGSWLWFTVSKDLLSLFFVARVEEPVAYELSRPGNDRAWV